MRSAHWFVAILIASTCVSCSCDPNKLAKPAPPADQAKPGHVVPTSARALLQVARLDGFLQLLGALTPGSSENGLIASSHARYSEIMGTDPWNAATWAAMGVDVASEARIFEDGRHWVVHARNAPDAAIDTWVAKTNSNANLKVTQHDVDDFDLYRVGYSEKDVAVLYVARGQEFTFVIPVGRVQPRWPHQREPEPLTIKEASARITRWSSLGKRERWIDQKWARDFAKQFADYPIRADVRPNAWMESAKVRGDKGQAAVVWERMRRLMGPIGLGLKFNPIGAEIEAAIRTTTDPREPTFVQELSGARGAVPAVGGLINPGVLGVVRVSADPAKFWTLFRSLLSANMRTEIDAIIQDYDEELSIDLMSDVLSNIKGHAVFVVYGFEADALKTDNPDLLSDIFSLSATREAVLLPIESRDRMEDVLNAATQLSKGRLNRQDTGETIQYAWIDDKGLEWAVILGKDHVIVVDSAAAFDHAVSYERSARPLSDAMQKRGLATLLKEKDRNGLYLDAQALANLLRETGNQDLASWLGAFSTILVHADESDIRATLRLDQYASE